MKKVFIGLLLIGLSIGCMSWRATDKCFITEGMFDTADKIYNDTKSLATVRKSLENAHWEQCEINEAVYRIEKVHHLDVQ